MDTPKSNTRACTVTDCPRPGYCRGFCRPHWYRFTTYGDPLAGESLRQMSHPETCTVSGCESPYLAKGFCNAHYLRFQIHGDPLYRKNFAKNSPCRADGCTALQRKKGFCIKHYKRYATHGDPEISLRSPRYGEGSITGEGYRMLSLPWHPNANKYGRVLEHRFVMSQMLGRPLLETERVHHKNGQRLDNRPENLELWVKTQPCGQRAVDLLQWAKSILHTYASLEQNPYFASDVVQGTRTRKHEVDASQLVLAGIAV